MPAGCIDDNDAALFVSGDLDESDRSRIENHVDSCPSCRVLLAELARQSTATVRSETLLPPGARVGRYLIGGVLGAGAMGVVYSAEDPQLGRRVALKLLRPSATSPKGSTVPAGDGSDEERLLAEAYALAQLSHPNVVTVFDAGRWENHVFIALELVRGGTLSEWLFAAPRPLVNVLAHFRAAGAGLAAAHAAGIVHRDFKPDNVLLGDDGRVRVTDFGLARELEEASTPGHVAGTRAYMAPEQLEAGTANANSDQYAFAVSLWEALYGVLPDLQRVTSRRGHSLGRVPRRIRRAVERGLARDPAARHPSLAAMVSRLAWDPAAQRRRLWVGALVALLVGGLAVMAARSTARARLCHGGEERFARVLGPARRATLSPVNGQGPLALEAAQRRRDRLAQLDAYRAQWIDFYSDACVATRVHGDQSEELLELRMSCLESRLQGVDELAGLLERNDPDLEKRMAGRDLLEPLQPCADRAALLTPLRPPRDPAARARVESTRNRLARIRVLGEAGEYEAARRQVAPLLKEARAIGYSPLLAEALLALASTEDYQTDPAAERDYSEAALIAEAAHHDSVVARARTHLYWVAAVRSGRVDQAPRLEREAEAAIARIGGDEELEIFLLNSRASLSNQTAEESQRIYQQIIARLEKHSGPPTLELGRAENNLATNYLDSGRPKDALPHFDRAITVEQALFGVHHPAVLLVRRNRAQTLGAIGHLRDVIADVRSLYADTEAAVGPDHLDTGYAAQLYGAALSDLAATRAQSLAPLYRALAIFSARLPPGSAEVATAHGILCEALLPLKRYAEAGPHCDALLAYAEKQPGQDSVELREALIAHANLLLGVGGSKANAQARAELERTFTLSPGSTVVPSQLALARFSLARALVALHGDRNKARRLATQAEATWATTGDDELLAEVRAWLKSPM